METTRGQFEPKRLLSRSLIKFTRLKFQATKSPGLAYEQVYAEVKIDVKHKYTELESRKHPKFVEEGPNDGVVSWEFYVGANELQAGIGFEDPASLVFKFHGTSDDEPPPLPPHFDIEVTSNWSLISPRADYSMNSGWPYFRGGSASEARYSTLCQLTQLIKLQVPSDLSQDTFHKSAAKVNQSSCQTIIEREGSCTVTCCIVPRCAVALGSFKSRLTRGRR